MAAIHRVGQLGLEVIGSADGADVLREVGILRIAEAYAPGIFCVIVLEIDNIGQLDCKFNLDNCAYGTALMFSGLGAILSPSPAPVFCQPYWGTVPAAFHSSCWKKSPL